MKYISVLVSTLLLTACMTSGGSSNNAAKNGCASAAAAIKVLTVARANHKLSTEQIAQVDAAKIKTDAVCKKAPYPTLNELQVQAVVELVNIAAKYKD